MARYILVRVASTVPLLLGSTLLLFALLRYIPGDPAHAILMTMDDPGADMSHLEQDMSRVRDQLGLNEPFLVQYWSWLTHVAHGNLGTSLRTRIPVADELARHVPATLELTAAALVVMVIIAVPTALLGSVYHGRTPDILSRAWVLLGASIPGFFLGLLLVYIFSVWLHWLPTFGRGSAAQLVLPSVTLGVGLAAGTSRLLRISLLDALARPYVAAAEARGLSRTSIVFIHALPNALLPVMTSAGLMVGGLLGGTVMVESVFAWPGVGRYLLDAISGRDYPVIQGFTVCMSVVYIVVNLLTDVLYRLVDPRVRIEQNVA